MPGIDEPGCGDEKLNLIIEGLPDNEKDRLLELLKQDKEQRESKKGEVKAQPNPELIGNRNAILGELKSKYVKLDNDVEMMGYKGKKLHIVLPARQNFEGFKFDCFISEESLYKDEFEANYELAMKSFGKNNISKLLKEINKYMKELGVETDGDMDYENDLQFPVDSFGRTCEAGKCLMEMTTFDGHDSVLDWWYWLKDEKIEETRRGGKENLRNMWGCVGPDVCYFKWGRRVQDCKLLLGLSD